MLKLKKQLDAERKQTEGFKTAFTEMEYHRDKYYEFQKAFHVAGCVPFIVSLLKFVIVNQVFVRSALSSLIALATKRYCQFHYSDKHFNF